MLLATVITKLELELPLLKFSIDRKKHIIIIPPVNEGFGDVVIDCANGEIILFIGNFTHCHFCCDENDLAEKEKAEIIAQDVVELLKDIFDKKVVMYKSHNGGGFEYGDEQRSQRSQLDLRQKWLWSGPIFE